MLVIGLDVWVWVVIARSGGLQLWICIERTEPIEGLVRQLSRIAEDVA